MEASWMVYRGNTYLSSAQSHVGA